MPARRTNPRHLIEALPQKLTFNSEIHLKLKIMRIPALNTLQMEKRIEAIRPYL